MNGWWWVPVGLIAWFVVAVAMGPLVGRVLRWSAQAFQTVGSTVEKMPADRQESPRNGRRTA